MLSMNILADFQSATNSINHINQVLSDFKRQARRIIALYDEDNIQPYLKGIDDLLNNISYRDMFLIIALLGDELRLNLILEDSNDKPNIILEKLFLQPKKIGM